MSHDTVVYETKDLFELLTRSPTTGGKYTWQKVKLAISEKKSLYLKIVQDRHNVNISHKDPMTD